MRKKNQIRTMVVQCQPLTAGTHPEGPPVSLQCACRGVRASASAQEFPNVSHNEGK